MAITKPDPTLTINTLLAIVAEELVKLAKVSTGIFAWAAFNLEVRWSSW